MRVGAELRYLAVTEKATEVDFDSDNEWVDVAVPTLPGEPLNGYTMTRITHDKQVNHLCPALAEFTATSLP